MERERSRSRSNKDAKNGSSNESRRFIDFKPSGILGKYENNRNGEA